MKTKAIIFDKDGTLIDFDSFWVTISEYAVKEMLEKVNMTNVPVEEILLALGVKDGVTSINGVLCYGTYKLMAEKIYGVLEKYNCKVNYEEIERLTLETHEKHSDKGVVKATCNNIKEVLSDLKSKGIILAVVTTDVLSVTNRCLTALEIDEFFDEIYTDDGVIKSKPAPDAANHLRGKYNLQADEVVMVGDTKTDISFAQNAGINIICVAKTDENKTLLLEHTNIVVKDISEVVHHIK